MPVKDERNILKIGPDKRAPYDEITPAMVEAVHQRIKDAGGTLDVWAVLHEDVYESRYGDGLYLHAHGLALNREDAHKLAALAGGNSEWVKWHVRSYRLALKDDMPMITGLVRAEEEFTINEFVVLLSELPPGGTASKLLTGTGQRKDGPFVSLPEK
jgi:hypothetical protein